MRRWPMRVRAARDSIPRSAGLVPFGPVWRDFRRRGDRPPPRILRAGLESYPVMLGRLSGPGLPWIKLHNLR